MKSSTVSVAVNISVHCKKSDHCENYSSCDDLAETITDYQLIRYEPRPRLNGTERRVGLGRCIRLEEILTICFPKSRHSSNPSLKQSSYLVYNFQTLLSTCSSKPPPSQLSLHSPASPQRSMPNLALGPKQVARDSKRSTRLM